MRKVWLRGRENVQGSNRTCSRTPLAFGESARTVMDDFRYLGPWAIEDRPDRGLTQRSTSWSRQGAALSEWRLLQGFIHPLKAPQSTSHSHPPNKALRLWADMLQTISGHPIDTLRATWSRELPSSIKFLSNRLVPGNLRLACQNPSASLKLPNRGRRGLGLQLRRLGRGEQALPCNQQRCSNSIAT
jgi:hypothetical protein